MPRIFIVGHDEIKYGVREAMIDQLRRDGRLKPGMEIGLIFFSSERGNMEVEACILCAEEVPTVMDGDRRQICAVITNLVLRRFYPGEIQNYKPEATVRFQSSRFTYKNGDTEYVFFAEVKFEEKAPAA